MEVAADAFEVLGIEPDETIYQSTAGRGLPVRLGYFPAVLQDCEKFDIIVFNDVFEHIPDSKQVLAACHDRLVDNGILLLNLPSSKGIFYRFSKILYRLGLGSFFERLWQKDMPSPHLHYFNAENLCELLGQYKFSIAEKGTLPALRLEGLYSRILYSKMSRPFAAKIIYLCIAITLPLFKILPSDIIYIVANKRK